MSEQATLDRPDRVETEAEAADRLLHGSSFGAAAAAYAEHRSGYASARTPRTWTESGDELMRDLTAVKAALKEHAIELPSWAFGNTGTRFKVFGQPGVPRTPWEKAEDAAQVHRYTGVAPSMAVHIPWDKVDDYAALARHAGDLGIRIGTVNANVFQDDDYKLGSVCPWPNGWAGRRPAGDPETVSDTQIEELIGRSSRLEADPRNANYAGGNTSAKGTATDPVTGGDVELIWVKGSGGDLGALCAGDLPLTTGLLIPVDAGVAAAFLR